MKSIFLCLLVSALFVSSCDSAPVPDPGGTMTVSLVYGTDAGVSLYLGREEGPDQSWPYVMLLVQIQDASMNFTPTAVSALDTAITQYTIRKFTGAEIASLGEVEGLGAVTEKPTSGWATASAVEANCGYVVRFKHSYDVSAPDLPYYYCRMYVDQILTNVYGGMIGAKVKYQGPF